MQMWEGGQFRRTTLHELGLRICVGHPGGALCPSYKPGILTFTVIHVNGLHRVNVDFCGCNDSLLQSWQQLMRVCWWPATMTDPQTVATFECLRQFEKVNCSGHVTATDYYRALAHMTDCTGLTELPVCFHLMTCALLDLTFGPGSGTAIHAHDAPVGTCKDDEALSMLCQTGRRRGNCPW
jgi:hypothetical protein